jgi:NAD(P)H-nitrite reductase large subunit
MKFEHNNPMKIILENKINLVQGLVTTVTGIKGNLLDNNAKIYDKLVWTGSKPNKYGWPGQDLQGVTGLYHKQDLALELGTYHKTL